MAAGRPRVGGNKARVTRTISVRLDAPTYAALLLYARAIGARHAGQPAPATAAREALVAFLHADQAKRVALREAARG